MIRFLRQPIELKRALGTIWAFPFPAELRREMCKEYVHLFTLGWVDKSRKTARLAGKEVSYCTVETLKYLFYEIFMRQSYYFKAHREDPVILDCGSNIGMSVLYFKSLYPKARITAFEPQPTAFHCLQETIQRNQLADVTAHAKALANETGEIAFYTKDESPGSLLASRMKERTSERCQMVSATKLSEYITGPVDFMKLDIEGGEQDVLIDLVESGKIQFIEQMAIEYHHHIIPEQDTLTSFLSLLESSGFGYQIEGKLQRPFRRGHFQDVCIYAYRKGEARTA
ncbi:FkbM family methyltransferase [Roseimicrobium sp. ORNL1]|uniref:FkbM family methyltransferase n=1 Tax=Roseimicrobium sp. ORNL1 TaxID=2711231 RepID=UPI0013E1D36A|nr:FkbM family methyltransferase [Roseimicrobium sp. ORNL1]QIF03894.1 FkbM family methyltransferase [Roseimicrobium sp. ORNL1]